MPSNPSHQPDNRVALLLPVPRRVIWLGGFASVSANGTVRAAEGLSFETACARAVLGWPPMADAAPGALDVVLLVGDARPPEGYTLLITPGEITILGGSAAGVFYGVQTLGQLRELYPEALPTCEITDAPSLAARGYMLDVSRDRVPTMDTLFALIDRLASWKVNQLQLYTEHTFAYPGHEVVWRDASPITAEELRALDNYCRARHILLVPNQNSLGHMERWLRHDAYRHLAECPDGFPGANGAVRPPTTLALADPASLSFVGALYDQLLPHVAAPWLNVGGDEPWELDAGLCRSAAASLPGDALYATFLGGLHAHATRHGRRMQFWGDIVARHPHLVPTLPTDAVAMVWGYEATDDLHAQAARYPAVGMDFMVCPGTSTWNSLAGRMDNALANMRQAVDAARQYGGLGVLITEWGDNGHWQPGVVGEVPLAYGASLAWNADAPPELALALDALLYGDMQGGFAQMLVDLGNVYMMTGPQHANGSLLAYALLRPQNDDLMAWLERLRLNDVVATPAVLDGVLAALSAAEEHAAQATLTRPDAALVQRELVQVARLLRHGVYRLLLAQGAPVPNGARAGFEAAVQEQRALWLARSRPGGLDDSLARFEATRQAYADRGVV